MNVDVERFGCDNESNIITTETFNVDFHNKFSKFWIILFFQLSIILSYLFPYLLIYLSIYIYIYHHVVPPTRISLNLSRHSSLSFIASGRSSGLHPVSSQSCCMHVRAGRLAFVWPYEGVHRSTSLISSSLLLQQCPAFLVRLLRR